MVKVFPTNRPFHNITHQPSVPLLNIADSNSVVGMMDETTDGNTSNEVLFTPSSTSTGVHRLMFEVETLLSVVDLEDVPKKSLV